MSEDVVEALLNAPDESPLGVRDRTMLELMAQAVCVSVSWCN
jgi:site-specific recombinase XerC